jgi:hypothetical protein
MIIPDNLKFEISEFCKLNEIPNVDEFCLKLLKQAFTLKKYGELNPPIDKIEKEIPLVVQPTTATTATAINNDIYQED